MFAHLYMLGMLMVASRGRDRGAAKNGHRGWVKVEQRREV